MNEDDWKRRAAETFFGGSDLSENDSIKQADKSWKSLLVLSRGNIAEALAVDPVFFAEQEMSDWDELV